MSNSESFIDEVSEEVRRDQLYKLIRRYGWIAVAAVLLIVGGATALEIKKSRETAAARALGDATLAAVQKDTPQARVEALSQVTDAGEAQVLVNLLIAGQELEAGNLEGAIAQFDAVINDPGVPESYRQVATLKKVMAQGEDASADSRRAALEPMIAPGQPFRTVALEQLALVEAAQDNTDRAIELLQQAFTSSDATGDLRQRVSQLIVALGGDLNVAQ